MSIKGTRTEHNLLAAFAGESQARNRYTYYASVARKEGYRQIEGIFQETADNEKEHAKRFFKHLGDGMTEITASYPFSLGTTAENLKAAAAGENEEHSELYPEFARIAREEGFNDVANTFENIAKVEVYHEKRFLELLENVTKERMFSRPEEREWKCLVCGYVHTGTSAPNKCPACAHPQEHYELRATNW